VVFGGQECTVRPPRQPIAGPTCRQSIEEEYKTSAKVTAARPQCGVRRVRVFQRNHVCALKDFSNSLTARMITSNEGASPKNISSRMAV